MERIVAQFPQKLPLIIHNENKITKFLLNRPESINSISIQISKGIIKQMKKNIAELIVIKSNVPTLFCAGGDVKEVFRLVSNNQVDLAMDAFQCFNKKQGVRGIFVNSNDTFNDCSDN